MTLLRHLWLYVVGACIVVIIQFPGNQLIDADSYYHVKLSTIYSSHGILRDFPWTQYALQKTGFGDKEFLFHVFLIPFATPSAVLGPKIFIVLVGASFFAAFVALLRTTKVPYDFIWVLLLCAGGELFWYRMAMVRPQVLSVTLTFLCLYAFFREKLWLILLLSFLYPLSYCAPQIVVAISIAYALAVALKTRRFAWKPLLTTITGLSLGFLVHPHFPHILKIWFVQNAVVMGQAASERSVLNLAGELASPTGAELLRFAWPIIGVALALTFYAINLQSSFSKETTTMYILGAIFLILTLISRRFLEYLVPVAALYCALTARDATLSSTFLASATHQRALKVLIPIGTIILTGVCVPAMWRVKQGVNHAQPSPYRDAAIWLRDNSAPNEVVFTADWDDFPELFYYNSKNYYIVALDPSFFYWYDAKSWRLWDQVRMGERKDAYSIIKNTFRSRLVFVTSDFKPFLKQIDNDVRFKKQFENRSCAVFELQDARKQH